jgi:ankyrin repeat protein
MISLKTVKEAFGLRPKPSQTHCYDRHENPLALSMEDACRIGDMVTVEKLLAQWTTYPKSEFFPFFGDPMFDFIDALVIAIEEQHLDIIACLIQNRVRLSDDSLCAAVQTRSIDVFSVLVKHGFDLNNASSCIWDYQSPTTWKFSHPPLLAYNILPCLNCSLINIWCSCILDTEPLLRWFLANGASPNVSNSIGIVPLNVAAAECPLSTIKLLIDNGADVKGSNALQITAGNNDPPPDQLDRLRYLLERGSDIDAFEYAYHEHGFTFHARLEEHPYREDAGRIVGSATALHRAAEAGNERVVAFLLESGADPCLRVQNVESRSDSSEMVVSGPNAKDIAEAQGYTGVVAILQKSEVR